MFNHSWVFVGHKQILVSQCLMTNCYLQPSHINLDLMI